MEKERNHYLRLDKLKTVVKNYIYGTKNPYSQWAAVELWKYVIEHNNNSIIFSIEQFIEKMNHFSTLHERDVKISEEQSYIFSTAYDTANYIYDTLNTIGYY